MIGHEKQRSFFKQAAFSGQLSHAYILTGTEGIGKKLFAKEFARGLLCQRKNFFAPCDCPSCKQIEAGAHPDFHVLEDKEDLKIAKIRELPEIVSMTPYGGKWKIVIIDNAHLLCQGGADAANALLKTVEEPGDNTLFMLITSRLDKLIATIQSRCLTVVFNPLSEKDLKTVLASKGSELAGVLPYSGGSVALAETLLETKAPELLVSIEKRDLHTLGMLLLNLKEKSALVPVLGLMQGYFIRKYKLAANPDIAVFIQYLAVLIRNMDYNVNMSLVLMELYAKLATLLSGARS